MIGPNQGGDVRTGMIVEYIRDISASLGGIRPLAQEEKLRTLHRRKDFVDMIGHIKTEMRLGMRLRVGLVNNGGTPKTPAWIHLPDPMPLYGSKEFEDMVITMHIQKPFLREHPFEMVVAVMAHELSHVVLTGIWHRLHQEEMAVDLTAMILGYRDFYRRGCEYSIQSEMDYETPFVDEVFSFQRIPAHEERITTTHRAGYLTRQEVVFAADFMDFKP